MAVDTSQFKNGLKIELDGEPFVITFFQHVKLGKGGAFVRTKVKNLLSGRSFERTFRAQPSAIWLRHEFPVQRKRRFFFMR